MYDERRKSVKVGERPKEYSEFPTVQHGLTEQLRRHIEEEKVKTVAFFESLIEEATAPHYKTDGSMSESIGRTDALTTVTDSFL
jgi:hypothetical protein